MPDHPAAHIWSHLSNFVETLCLLAFLSEVVGPKIICSKVNSPVIEIWRCEHIKFHIQEMTILSIKNIRLIIKQCKKIIEIRLLFWVEKKKAHQAIDVTHGFINFMPDVPLQKTIASQFSHYVSKIFSSYKNLNKASICL